MGYSLSESANSKKKMKLDHSMDFMIRDMRHEILVKTFDVRWNLGEKVPNTINELDRNLTICQLELDVKIKFNSK
jgi:hypothetical protein